MAFLFDPVTLFALGMLSGAVGWWRSRAFAYAMWLASCLVFYGLSTPYLGARLLQSLESDPPLFAAEPLPQGPQAIVVLGAGLHRGAPEYGDDTAGRLTFERLRYGATLHRRSGLPILVSGGYLGDDDEPLSVVMKRVLKEDLGVTARWTEERSGNTYENATESAAVLGADGVTSVFLVTHAWHMPRAAEAFRRAGLEVTAAGTAFTRIGREFSISDWRPGTGALSASGYAIHEYVGRAWYHVAYY